MSVQQRRTFSSRFAVAHIRERVERGDIPRNDFFAQKGGAQDNGEQLFEGILLKARGEYEEKKIQCFGRFFANLTFADDVSSSVASLLIKTLERLTYRQLVFLALVHRVGKINVKNLRTQNHSNSELEALKREEMDLHGGAFGSMGLIHGSGPFDDKLGPLGMMLVELGELSSISEAETAEILRLLELCPPTDGLLFFLSSFPEVRRAMLCAKIHLLSFPDRHCFWALYTMTQSANCSLSTSAT